MVWSPCSLRDSQESSPVSQLENINSSMLSHLYGPTCNWYWAIFHILNSPTWLGVVVLDSRVQFSSVVQSCPTLCDPMDCSTPVFPVYHQLPEFTQTHVRLSWWCHPTISSSVVLFSSHLQSFQQQGLFKWVSSLHQVAKVLEFKLQYQSFQWIFRTDL